MPIPFNVNVFERGTGGIPSTTLVDDLGGRIDSLTFSITDKFGFESATIPLKVTPDEAIVWMRDGLGRGVAIQGPNGETCWQGRIIGIEAVFGLDARSVSLDGMANRARVRYTTVLGTPGSSSQLSDTNSQGLYGVKDAVLSIDMSDSTEAGYYATVELARLKNPRMRPATSIATGDQGEVSLTLQCEGWYGALGWLTTSNSSTTKTSTTTQVGTLITAYNSTNAFFSTSTSNITSSGITAQEYIEADTTYREKIEVLLGLGTGTAPLRWGVYEDRVFYVTTWAGSTPSTITYLGASGDSNLYNATGNVVLPWNARPNAMYQNNSLLDISPVSTAQDAAARFYVARTVFTIEGDQITLSLEPEEPEELSAIFIRKY